MQKLSPKTRIHRYQISKVSKVSKVSKLGNLNVPLMLVRSDSEDDVTLARSGVQKLKRKRIKKNGKKRWKNVVAKKTP